MTQQKIFGLVVTDQKVPLLEKPDTTDQCYLCGFRFNEEDCMIISIDKEFTDRRKVHSKCISNHLQLLPKETKIAIISVETNEILSYAPVNQ
ncbi:MAG: hypothetical protein EAX90_02795 [Candidatus Heimdallarchaeota archaeon]|nr:hypothetical protein [Candidatus Heimdallarchaeota archaeon]